MKEKYATGNRALIKKWRRQKTQWEMIFRGEVPETDLKTLITSWDDFKDKTIRIAALHPMYQMYHPDLCLKELWDEVSLFMQRANKFFFGTDSQITLKPYEKFSTSEEDIALVKANKKLAENLPSQKVLVKTQQAIAFKALNKILDHHLEEQLYKKEKSLRTCFGLFQPSNTKNPEAINALKSALRGEVDKTLLLKHLSTLRSGELGKAIRKFVKDGSANDIVGQEVKTVRDFIKALAGVVVTPSYNSNYWATKTNTGLQRI
ncbi:hypothetical protein ACQUW5_00965 [Legionella sp. CNM-1927-20]|uniref:hypothetical protein n=1 Tax=Legionella sp. CNM-1927-20 TaxID=3422221 RepID=UPI00403AD09D